MNNLNFKTWIEESSVKKNAIKDMVLSFLKDKMGITGEDEILFMSLKSINPSIIRDLFTRGIISNIDPVQKTELQNSDITISELINRISE